MLLNCLMFQQRIECDGVHLQWLTAVRPLGHSCGGKFGLIHGFDGIAEWGGWLCWRIVGLSRVEFGTLFWLRFLPGGVFDWSDGQSGRNFGDWEVGMI